jgi:hypothetical protein
MSPERCTLVRTEFRSRSQTVRTHDSQGRRFSKIVSNWTGSVWTRALHEKFLYDGWNLIGVLNGTNDTILKSFLWGLDLAGSLQGAGGVGGLIAFASRQTPVTTHFAAYDGNGNVVRAAKTPNADCRPPH